MWQNNCEYTKRMKVNILRCWNVVGANDMIPPVESQKARYIGQYTNNNRVTPVFLFWVNK